MPPVLLKHNPVLWLGRHRLTCLTRQPAPERPAIVADGYGYVHVFWSEEVGGESILDKPDALIHTGNTIYYTRWDGTSWTQPTDILFVPNDSVADYIAVTVDKENRLHVVWTGSSNFYYSTALPWEADSAQAWSKPVAIAGDSARTQWESDIVTDAKGGIHIVYATKGDEPGVYHIQSSDGGLTWSSAVKLSLPLDDLEVAFSNVRAIVDGTGSLHAVWQTNQEEGFGQGIYYARSTNGGAEWTPPSKMANRDPGEYGVSFPSIASIGTSELHMVYIDGPWHIGRYHRISLDGGKTWSEPQHIFTDFEGINGYPLLLVDGSGQLNLVITWRTRTQIGGTYYARWLGTQWSPMEPVALETEQTGPGAHWTAATMRLGNEIHVLWNTNFSDQAGEIWHANGTVPGVASAKALSVTKITTPVPTSSAALDTPVSQPANEVAPESAAPGKSSPNQPVSPPPQVSIARVLLISAAPALLLVLGAVACKRWRPRRVL